MSWAGPEAGPKSSRIEPPPVVAAVEPLEWFSAVLARNLRPPHGVPDSRSPLQRDDGRHFPGPNHFIANPNLDLVLSGSRENKAPAVERNIHNRDGILESNLSLQPKI